LEYYFQFVNLIMFNTDIELWTLYFANGLILEG